MLLLFFNYSICKRIKTYKVSLGKRDLQRAGSLIPDEFPDE